jgi:hypothetical protein
VPAPIDWIHTQNALAPEKPFFVYFAPDATHAPHTVPLEWADKYAGQFADGWDAQREAIITPGRNSSGVVPEDAELTSRPDALPAWADMDGELKPVLERRMEIYAAFLEQSRKVIERAKGLLMTDRRMTEPEAFRWLQRTAMGRRASMLNVATARSSSSETRSPRLHRRPAAADERDARAGIACTAAAGPGRWLGEPPGSGPARPDRAYGFVVLTTTNLAPGDRPLGCDTGGAPGDPVDGAAVAAVEDWCTDTGYPLSRSTGTLAAADLLRKVGHGDSAEMGALLAQAIPRIPPHAVASAGPVLTGRIVSSRWPIGGPPDELLGPSVHPGKPNRSARQAPPRASIAATGHHRRSGPRPAGQILRRRLPDSRAPGK